MGRGRILVVQGGLCLNRWQDGQIRQRRWRKHLHLWNHLSPLCRHSCRSFHLHDEQEEQAAEDVRDRECGVRSKRRDCEVQGNCPTRPGRKETSSRRQGWDCWGEVEEEDERSG